MDQSLYENFFLKDNYYLCLPFKQGNAYFRVVSHEDMIINPGATAGQLGYIGDVTPGSLSSQVENSKPVNKYMMEPKDESLIYHMCWGASPSVAQIYMYYPANQSLQDLRDIRTESDEEFGFIYGRDSPYHNPNPQLTEVFTLKGIHPAWKARIPSSCSATTYPCLMRFVMRKYKVEVLMNTKDTPVDARAASLASRRSFAGLSGVDVPDWLGKYIS